jgi:hypothetical protein
MKMLWHQHPADQKKIELGADCAQSVDKDFTVLGIKKNWHTAVRAAGDKLQLPRLEVAMVKWHRASISFGLEEPERGEPQDHGYLSDADLKRKVCASPGPSY